MEKESYTVIKHALNISQPISHSSVYDIEMCSGFQTVIVDLILDMFRLVYFALRLCELGV